MRITGHEFGSTTGRPRRCGWLDITALNHTVMLNGVTELVMMKADVLNAFENLNISMNYRFNNEIIDYIPFEDNKVEPVYKSVKGWNCEIDKVKKEEDFPPELNDYIRLIESETGVKISVVSLGPDRLQTIFR
jgi:adenylosuccinate synthase